MERQEFIIHGNGLDDENREAADDFLKRSFQEGLQPTSGEIKKSKETLAFLERINGYLNAELEDLGLKKVVLDARRIHILPPEDFKKNFPDAESTGIYLNTKDGIYVTQDTSRLPLYHALLHEVVHQISYRSFYDDIERKKFSIMRSGYTNTQASEEKHEHFRGLNEAVVDTIVKEIFVKHQNELIEDFGITDEEQRASVPYYHDYMEILDLVMDKIALKNGESKELVWSRFKKGEFTGEMMHLRDVERTFGKGSLRVLAALDSGMKDIRFSKLMERAIIFFQVDDDETREKIAKEILTERERLRYLQRKE